MGNTYPFQDARFDRFSASLALRCFSFPVDPSPPSNRNPSITPIWKTERMSTRIIFSFISLGAALYHDDSLENLNMRRQLTNYGKKKLSRRKKNLRKTKDN